MKCIMGLLKNLLQPLVKLRDIYSYHYGEYVRQAIELEDIDAVVDFRYHNKGQSMINFVRHVKPTSMSMWRQQYR